ncbi:MAG TPA: isoprenylcysteine carboxylmethyltransferase family protein [Terriglobales bacterium]|nr:isoprenylcysteine carboxylmethyltransferase family protein [Terriglobales bacterium]
MPWYAYAVILLGIVVWFYPFVSAHKGTSAAKTVDRRSRWGVLLQFAAFTLIWQGHFWQRSLPAWRLALSVILFLLAALLSWSSSRALAGQLRIDAALGAEHKLVRSGPYALVRNPIYTSMLLVLCAMAVIVAPWKLFAAALILFVVGTEIRVRIEERMLASHFGEEFTAYRRDVPAYIPFF